MSARSGHAGRNARTKMDAAVRAEFGLSLEQSVREMFAADYPLQIIAAVLDVSYQFVHKYIHELGLRRPPIHPDRRAPVRERVQQAICADRIMGATYPELRARYGVSAGVVNRALRAGAPDYVGTRAEPVLVRPPRLSAEERARRSAARRALNQAGQRGWKEHYEGG